MKERAWMTTQKQWRALREKALLMRQNPTIEERRLWSWLRTRRFSSHRFRRQHPVGPFIVDFYCSAAKLVIEIDGPIHESTQEEDASRQRFIESRGLSVLRFSGAQVMQDIDGVLNTIRSHIAPDPPGCRRGGG